MWRTLRQAGYHSERSWPRLHAALSSSKGVVQQDLQDLRLIYHSNGVLQVELHRPDRLNALGQDMGQSLLKLVHQIEHSSEDDSPRCVVLTGCRSDKIAGRRAFSTGRDLKESTTHVTPEQKREYMNLALDTVLAVKQRLPCPTIAAVAGPAFGWGAELALACDLRFCAKDATICFPETSLGIFPGAAGAVLLPRLIPPHLAKEIIFTAKRLSGEEAARYGLVNSVVTDPLEEALEVAHRIAGNAPLGVRGAKQVIDVSADVDFEAGLDLTRLLRPPLTNTEDFQEGLLSFKERRPPVFKGR